MKVILVDYNTTLQFGPRGTMFQIFLFLSQLRNSRNVMWGVAFAFLVCTSNPLPVLISSQKSWFCFFPRILKTCLSIQYIFSPRFVFVGFGVILNIHLASLCTRLHTASWCYLFKLKQLSRDNFDILHNTVCLYCVVVTNWCPYLPLVPCRLFIKWFRQ